jgi:hypothetical protein
VTQLGQDRVEKRLYRSRFSRFLDQIWVAEQLPIV